MSDSFSEQCIDVTAAIEQITQQTRNDLWEAIEEWENLLLDKIPVGAGEGSEKGTRE